MNKRYLFDLITEMSTLKNPVVQSKESCASDNKLRVIDLPVPHQSQIKAEGKTLTLVEHHISIYQDPITDGPFQNHYHYTVTAVADNITYKAHIYFNDKDRISTEVEPAFISVKDEKRISLGIHKQALLDGCMHHIGPTIANIRTYQKQKISELKTKITKLDQQASELSRNIKYGDDSYTNYSKLIEQQKSLYRELGRYESKLDTERLLRSIDKMMQSLKPCQVTDTTTTTAATAATAATVISSASCSTDQGRKTTETVKTDSEKEKEKKEEEATVKPKSTTTTDITKIKDLESRLNKLDFSQIKESSIKPLKSILSELNKLIPSSDEQFSERLNELKDNTIIKLRLIFSSIDILQKNINWLLENKDVLSLIDIPDEIYLKAIETDDFNLLSRLIQYQQIPAHQKFIVDPSKHDKPCNIMETCLLYGSAKCFEVLIKNNHPIYYIDRLDSPLLALLNDRRASACKQVILKQCDFKQQSAIMRRFINCIEYLIKNTTENCGNAQLLKQAKLISNFAKNELKLQDAIIKKINGTGRIESHHISNLLGKVGSDLSDEQYNAIVKHPGVMEAMLGLIDATINLFECSEFNSTSATKFIRNKAPKPDEKISGMITKIEPDKIPGFIIVSLGAQKRTIERLCYLFKMKQIVAYNENGPVFKNKKELEKHEAFVKECSKTVNDFLLGLVRQAVQQEFERNPRLFFKKLEFLFTKADQVGSGRVEKDVEPTTPPVARPVLITAPRAGAAAQDSTHGSNPNHQSSDLSVDI